MKATTAAAALVFLSLASPSLADDQGNANAEQQTQPTPNRGGTAGGPGHGPGVSTTGSAQGEPAGATERTHPESGQKDGHRH